MYKLFKYDSFLNKWKLVFNGTFIDCLVNRELIIRNYEKLSKRLKIRHYELRFKIEK